MPTTWFIVVESLGRWWVDHEGKTYGPFESQQDALDNAPRLARLVADDRDWEVFVSDAAGPRLVASARSESGR